MTEREEVRKNIVGFINQSGDCLAAIQALVDDYEGDDLLSKNEEEALERLVSRRTDVVDNLIEFGESTVVAILKK